MSLVYLFKELLIKNFLSLSENTFLLMYRSSYLNRKITQSSDSNFSWTKYPFKTSAFQIHTLTHEISNNTNGLPWMGYYFAYNIEVLISTTSLPFLPFLPSCLVSSLCRKIWQLTSVNNSKLVYDIKNQNQLTVKKFERYKF